MVVVGVGGGYPKQGGGNIMEFHRNMGYIRVFTVITIHTNLPILLYAIFK